MVSAFIPKTSRTLVFLACVLLTCVALAAEIPSAQSGSTVQVSAGVMAAQTASKTVPVYPQEAKDAHIQGSVTLHAVIGKDGTVQSLKLVSGPDVLARSAWTAVKDWTYKPYLLNGRPATVETTITVNYTLGS